MHLDVTDLITFYASPTGLMVRRLLGHRIHRRWRHARGETIIGLGYAVPYLGGFRASAARLGALMPAAQGVVAWPREGPYQSLLVAEDMLPLADASVDKLIAVHSLEMSEGVRGLLREAWRVLKPEGDLLLIVANRRGLWTRSDTTPFGHGRPYSRRQLRGLLGAAMFETGNISPVLHVPPVRLALLQGYAPAIERLGARLWPAFCGAFIVEASKRLHAPAGGEAVRERRIVFRPAAAANPASPRRNVRILPARAETPPASRPDSE